MQQKPHPLAQIMHPLLDDIDKIYEQTSNKDDLTMISSLVNVISPFYFKNSLYIYYLLYVKYDGLLERMVSVWSDDYDCSIDIVYAIKIDDTDKLVENYTLEVYQNEYIEFGSAITKLSIARYIGYLRSNSQFVIKN